MPSIKIKKNHIFLVVFIVFYLVTRLPRLSSDVINPDAVNWHYRSEQFIVGLKTRQFEKTNQHYHPGVTLMWLVGGTVEFLKQLSPEDSVYTHYNFSTFHHFSKLVLVFVQLILSLILIYVLGRVVGFYKALFSVSLFTFEPFFIGNSRLLHLDILVTLFLFIGLLISYLNLKEFSWIKGLFSGGFLAAAFLTKSIAIGGIIFVLVTGGILALFSGGYKKCVSYVISILIPFVLVTFIFFPALWVNPVGTLVEIYNESERIGIRRGHGQIFLNEYSRDPGKLFYFVVIALKVSPAFFLGLFVGFIAEISSYFRRFAERIELEEKRPPLKQVIGDVMGSGLFFIKKASGILHIWGMPVVFLAFFYVGYFIVMSFPSKKLDRYMLPMFPFFALLAVLGYYRAREVLPGVFKKVFYVLIFLVFFTSLILPLTELFPYYFTYTNPVFGSAYDANKIIGQKPFGVGIPKLKRMILENYGYYPSLGFIDVKPMRAIYMNSRIFDIRVSGTRKYDLLVLAVNEEIPQKVLDSGTSFVKDKVMRVNGLEYWRIYVKDNK